MLFRELVTKCRSYRKFSASAAVPDELLRDLVELACYVPSKGNLQPLKYLAVSDAPDVAAVFSFLLDNGPSCNWPGTAEEERPMAFIVMLGDLRISSEFSFDSGIAAQTILLGATDAGYGGCMTTSLDREGIREQLHIPGYFSILMVIALGKPLETVVIDQISGDDPTASFEDAHHIHHVPKRMLDDVLLEFRKRSESRRKQ
ncbi:MAG: nitroreductase family protein [Chlorobiaceae bacterium]|nr:nitroreductase family protein [Chlorobiaceae bacterium]